MLGSVLSGRGGDMMASPLCSCKVFSAFPVPGEPGTAFDHLRLEKLSGPRTPGTDSSAQP